MPVAARHTGEGRIRAGRGTVSGGVQPARAPPRSPPRVSSMTSSDSAVPGNGNAVAGGGQRRPPSVDMSDLDVAVIGGGAAGLSAALVLSRARRDVLVVDSGMPRNAPAAHMHGFLSRDGLPPGELLTTGRPEVRGMAGTVVEGAVGDLVPDGAGGSRVLLADGRRISARRLLVATGLRDELPDIPGCWSGGLATYCTAPTATVTRTATATRRPRRLPRRRPVRPDRPQWSPTSSTSRQKDTLTAVERSGAGCARGRDRRGHGEARPWRTTGCAVSRWKAVARVHRATASISTPHSRSSSIRTRFTVPSTIPIARATSCERSSAVSVPSGVK